MQFLKTPLRGLYLISRRFFSRRRGDPGGEFMPSGAEVRTAPAWRESDSESPSRISARSRMAESWGAWTFSWREESHPGADAWQGHVRGGMSSSFRGPRWSRAGGGSRLRALRKSRRADRGASDDRGRRTRIIDGRRHKAEESIAGIWAPLYAAPGVT